ncbi:GGDEF domain-containing protein [Clostridium saccharobutylicum]|uniref:Phytochrome-like protein Cph2 n=2 Tax=Clostridium saccharobutylicum TaxID=169679 RepID=U5MUM3_CLOSA|nr:diguanylate cyclase [Clostridium saccharobutylicum]AGX43142.1 phytochrome-like protein Cph2 [Clostridium saccharobutylicum DSM 13864]AQR90439.1 phytochrome-like protein cph2 [Clostridium saccharobutylicum]AQS00345.1 phytochrome-like protein cph2 [Clostridium saccharobutylicum]AQS14328.1 phytochrome-like protein cph2 [Clostridium saccharobutylicum]MBA2906610.1 diguanylate cyclase (GGDEF)-like protein [Clostridium saccharobutylicum]
MLLKEKFIKKHILLFSFILAIFMLFVVDFLKIPNPNVVLLAVMVYLTFLGGFRCGILSGFTVISYSIYFFSIQHNFISFSIENFKKVIIIMLVVPVLILIVGTLKKQYVLKTKELQLANKELKRIARIDSLTGVANRRYFDEVLLNEYNSAIRQRSFLSLLMIDVDFFKNYNDNYGHVLGDECLKLVIQAISKELYHPENFIARYGGEEFVVLLPNTDDKGAIILAEKIVESVFSYKIPHCASKNCSYITVSIGVTTLTNFEEENALNLLNGADKALYLAKKNGRNQSRFFKI